VKAAAVSRALRDAPTLRESIVHTGQHYDPMLSDVFFRELEIPAPERSLGVGSGRHGVQTGEMLAKIEQALEELRPDVVVVYGDTNSTLAGALAAAKMRIPVAHVEAGLRSYNRTMPEEINRVLTDHVSSLLFCPTSAAVENLRREGVTANVSHVGDVMYDIALQIAPVAEARASLRSHHSITATYVAATIHRAENTDDPHRLTSLFQALDRLAQEAPVLIPVHPRTRAALARLEIKPRHVTVLEPLGFLDMTYLLRHAAAVVTDSGGVQKEAYFHGVPCVTTRTETEWIETVATGWNHLVSPDDANAIVAAAQRAIAAPRPTTRITEYGEGSAAVAIVKSVRTLAGG
jgi:UDP-GlcNAc3NAcA epimerase